MPELNELTVPEQYSLLRKRKRVTIRQLSKDLDIPTAYISLFENEKYHFEADILAKIKQYLTNI